MISLLLVMMEMGSLHWRNYWESNFKLQILASSSTFSVLRYCNLITRFSFVRENMCLICSQKVGCLDANLLIHRWFLKPSLCQKTLLKYPKRYHILVGKLSTKYFLSGECCESIHVDSSYHSLGCSYLNSQVSQGISAKRTCIFWLGK
jgi:hypothetical protein